MAATPYQECIISPYPYLGWLDLFNWSNLCRKPYCWLHCQLKRDIDRKFWQSFLFSPPLADCDIFNQFGIVLTKLWPSFAWLFFSSFPSNLESFSRFLCILYIFLWTLFFPFLCPLNTFFIELGNLWILELFYYKKLNYVVYE